MFWVPLRFVNEHTHCQGQSQGGFPNAHCKHNKLWPELVIMRFASFFILNLFVSSCFSQRAVHLHQISFRQFSL